MHQKVLKIDIRASYNSENTVCLLGNQILLNFISHIVNSKMVITFMNMCTKSKLWYRKKMNCHYEHAHKKQILISHFRLTISRSCCYALQSKSLLKKWPNMGINMKKTGVRKLLSILNFINFLLEKLPNMNTNMTI